MKIFLTIIFLALSFNSFAHIEDFNEKEKKIENKLRNDKNWPALIALYNLHSFTEDFGCSRVLPYAKIVKKDSYYIPLFHCLITRKTSKCLSAINFWLT